MTFAPWHKWDMAANHLSDSPRVHSYSPKKAAVIWEQKQLAPKDWEKCFPVIPSFYCYMLMESLRCEHCMVSASIVSHVSIACLWWSCLSTLFAHTVSSDSCMQSVLVVCFQEDILCSLWTVLWRLHFKCHWLQINGYTIKNVTIFIIKVMWLNYIWLHF